MVLSGRVRRRCGFCGCRSHVRGECFVVTSRGVRRECSSFVCPKCKGVELVKKSWKQRRR